RVIYQNVEFPKLFDALSESGLDLRWIGYINLNRNCAPAGRMKFLHNRVEFLKIPATDCNVGACLSQHQRTPPPNTLRSPRHQCHLVFQKHGCPSSQRFYGLQGLRQTRRVFDIGGFYCPINLPYQTAEYLARAQLNEQLYPCADQLLN